MIKHFRKCIYLFATLVLASLVVREIKYRIPGEHLARIFQPQQWEETNEVSLRTSSDGGVSVESHQNPEVKKAFGVPRVVAYTEPPGEVVAYTEAPESNLLSDSPSYTGSSSLDTSSTTFQPIDSASTTISPTGYNFASALQQFEREDAALRFTPLGRKCSQEFGLDLIRRWQQSYVDVCTGFKSSHISCYRRDIHQDPRLLCTAFNSQIQTQPPFFEASSSDLSDAVGTVVRAGLLKVDCELTMHPWIPVDQWVRPTANFMKNITTVPTMHCTNYVNHTVFWMERYDEKNMYHVSEDLVTTFETLLVLNEDPAEMELVIYDGLPAVNALFDLWKYIFGKGVRVLRANRYPEGTCFRSSIFNMFGGTSHLSHNGGVTRNTMCRSPILKAMRSWMMGQLSLQWSSRTPSGKYKIVFISRGHYANRTIGRVIPNESELLSYIQAQLSANYSEWELKVFQPELYSTFNDQVQVVSDAMILIGIHGAGLTFTLYLPPGAHLIEIFHSDRNPTNRHYRNICVWTDIRYHFGGEFASEIPQEELWVTTENVIRRVQEA